MLKQLYCDIDSTINNHWVRIQKWALPQYPGNKINPKAFTRKEIMKDKPLPDARWAIKRLSEFYEIHFLTARNFTNAFKITKDWLDMWEFRYNSINIVPSVADKVTFLRNNVCDLFIDDLSTGHHYAPPYTCLEESIIADCTRYNIPFIIFSNNWREIVNNYLNSSTEAAPRS